MSENEPSQSNPHGGITADHQLPASQQQVLPNPSQKKSRPKVAILASTIASSLGTVAENKIPTEFKVKDATIHFLKDKAGNNTGARLGLVLDEDSLVTSFMIKQYPMDHEDEDKRGGWGLFVTKTSKSFDAQDNPQFVSTLWYGREWSKGGKPGRSILRQMPCKPLLPVARSIAMALKNDNFRKTLEDSNLFKKDQVVTIGAETMKVDVLSIAMEELPEEVREISILGAVDNKGKIGFNAASNFWAFGLQPNQMINPNEGDRNRQPNWQVGGEITPAGNAQNASIPADLLKAWENTLKTALKLALSKLPGSPTELVVTPRETKNKKSADKHEQWFSQEFESRKKTETQPKAEAEEEEETPAGAIAGTEISFDEIP